MQCLFLVGGFLTGVICAWTVWRLGLSSGILRIDHSNSKKDVYRFEIDDLDLLHEKDYILLKIEHEADLSQK